MRIVRLLVMPLKLRILLAALICAMLTIVFCCTANAENGHSLENNNNASSENASQSDNQVKKTGFWSQDNAKLFRDVTIAVCALSSGYSVVFQINPASDKHGHVYQQDNHLHLLAIKKRIKHLKRTSSSSSSTVFRLPTWIFLPIPLSFASILVATVVYEVSIISNKELWVIILAGLSILSSVLSISYIVSVHVMLYSNRWLGIKVRQICKEANGLFSVLATSEKDVNDVKVECVRSVTSAFYSLEYYESFEWNYVQDYFRSLINGSAVECYFSNAIKNAGCSYSVTFEPQITCLIQLVKAHCTLASSTPESIRNLMDTIVRLNDTATTPRGCLIIGICVIVELSEMIRQTRKSEKDNDVKERKKPEKYPDFRFRNYNIEKNLDVLYAWLCEHGYREVMQSATYKKLLGGDFEIEEETSPFKEIKRYLYLRKNEVSA